MIKIASVGEILLRLPFEIEGFNKESRIYWGGAEANSICILSKWGNKCKFITKLPENKIGELALDNLQSYGVDTKNIAKGGDRVGSYYYMAPRQHVSGEVVYDRAYSSINNIEEGDFNYEEIFKDVDFFYVTGITLALGCKDEVAKMWDYAKSKGIKLVFDVNYRTKLWTLDEAKKVIPKFMKESDILFASPFDIREFLGLDADKDEDLYIKTYKTYNVSNIARLKREFIHGNLNQVSAFLCSDGKVSFTDSFKVNIKERIGGGDSFVAGLLQGLFNKENNPLQFALMGVLMKYSILGDVLDVNVSSVRSNVNSLGLDVKR